MKLSSEQVLRLIADPNIVVEKDGRYITLRDDKDYSTFYVYDTQPDEYTYDNFPFK